MSKKVIIQKRTVRKELELKLEVYSPTELIAETYLILRDLKAYPNENKFQIKYYTILWNLLLEY